MYLGTCEQSGPGAIVLQGGRVVRLGAGTVVGEAIGKGITSAAAAAGPAAPVVAAVGELVSVISSFFGGGCGNACVESATLEQVPEVALDDLWAVAQAGMLSQSDFLSAYNAILSYGIQKLQALEASDSKAAGGITNLQSSTANYQGLAENLPAVAPVALNLTAAQELFTNPSAPGWEPGAVQAGNNLALQVLQSLAASSPVAGIAAAFGLPTWALLLGGAAVLWLVL